jgi:hypothetical protein
MAFETEKPLGLSMKAVSNVAFIDPQGVCVIIDKMPRGVQAFFEPMRDRLTRPRFAHLWAMVLAIAVTARSSKLLHLAAMTLRGPGRTALGLFLRGGGRGDAPGARGFDAASLLRERTLAVLRSMRPAAGESVELIIDDNRVGKRGRKMACLQKIYDHARRNFTRGHIWVTAALRFRGVVLPWRVELWKPKKDADGNYRKTTQIAAQVIRELDLSPLMVDPGGRDPRGKGLKVRVLFDAFYLCPAVTKACESKGFSWFSVAARNRTFRRGGPRSKKAKLGALAGSWLRHEGKTARMPRSRGTRELRIAGVDGTLASVGVVRLVASKRPGDPWKNLVVFATNETKLSAREIVSIYERRWDIEVMFKELRTNLGWGDYQMLDETAIVNHQHLCALAHLLLTHHGMDAIGAQARKPNQEVTLPPMSIRRETLRATIRRDQINRLLRGKEHRYLRRKVEPYLTAA